MILTRKSLSRRAMLRGLGAAIALPFLDSMTPAFAAASRLGSAVPRRMAFLYVPNGIIMNQYTPATAGADYQITRLLQPVAAFREDLTTLGTHPQRRPGAGRWPRRSRPRGLQLSHFRPPRQDFRRRYQGGSLGRPDRRAGCRRPDQVSLARTHLRGWPDGRQLRFGLQLRV